MCEPHHSIVQWPPQDQQGGWGRGLLSGIGKWTKEIKGWFHLSKMGLGHSESVGTIPYLELNRRLWDSATKYECAWWNREVKFDGCYLGPYAEQDFALELTTQYCNAVSIGNLTALRRFLTESFKNTSRLPAYLYHFRHDFLNVRGRAQYDKLLKLLKGGKNNERLTKLCLGFTRKRDLIVPEWADDGKLW